MDITHLLPYITGAGGALVVLVLAVYLILTGKVVTGREHDRLLRDYDKLVQANDTLTSSLQACRDNNAQLLSTGVLANRVLDAFGSLAAQRGVPPPPTHQEGG